MEWKTYLWKYSGAIATAVLIGATYCLNEAGNRVYKSEMERLDRIEKELCTCYIARTAFHRDVHGGVLLEKGDKVEFEERPSKAEKTAEVNVLKFLRYQTTIPADLLACPNQFREVGRELQESHLGPYSSFLLDFFVYATVDRVNLENPDDKKARILRKSMQLKSLR